MLACLAGLPTLLETVIKFSSVFGQGASSSTNSFEVYTVSSARKTKGTEPDGLSPCVPMIQKTFFSWCTRR